MVFPIGWPACWGAHGAQTSTLCRSVCHHDPEHGSDHVREVDDDLRRSSGVAGRLSCPGRRAGFLRRISGRRGDGVSRHGLQGEVAMSETAGGDEAVMISPDTGEPLRRGVRPFTVTYKGQSVAVDLPG